MNSFVVPPDVSPEVLKDRLEAVSSRLDRAAADLELVREQMARYFERQLLEVHAARAVLGEVAVVVSDFQPGEPPAEFFVDEQAVNAAADEPVAAQGGRPKGQRLPLLERAPSEPEWSVGPSSAGQGAEHASASGLDPALEKATLIELNEALARAFSEITERSTNSH